MIPSWAVHQKMRPSTTFNPRVPTIAIFVLTKPQVNVLPHCKKTLHGRSNPGKRSRWALFVARLAQIACFGANLHQKVPGGAVFCVTGDSSDYSPPLCSTRWVRTWPWLARALHPDRRNSSSRRRAQPSRAYPMPCSQTRRYRGR